MKQLVLTFDDGPDPIYTKEILNLLKNENIKATFFVVAENAEKYPELIHCIKKDGHCIALHSLNHRHALLSSYHYMKYDFSRSLELLQSMNCNIKFYRPPWGARNIFTGKLVKRHNLTMVLWDVMVGDWKANHTSNLLADRILRKVFPGAIICLHDGCEKYGGAKNATPITIDALKSVLPKLKEEGYNFITVEEFYNNA